MFKFNKNISAKAPRRSEGITNRPGDNFDMSSYRRGTTLSTFHSTKQDQTKRQKLNHLRIMRRRLFALLAVMLGMMGLGAALLLQFTNSISDVKSNGVSLSESDKKHYIDVVANYFKSNSFERFSFARRSSVLSNYIIGQAPEVKSLKIVPSGLSSSNVELNFRRPVAMWTSGGNTRFVDESGSVFERNYYSKPSISIEDNSGVKVSGDAVTSSTFLSFVGKTAVAINKTGSAQVDRVVIPQGSARYVEFYLSGRTYPFKAQIDRDETSQASDITTMARYISSHNIAPEYVDCRVAGKAYWK